MTSRRMRVLSAAALSAAALALATPAVANAGGTHDPAYSHPPTSAAPAPETTQQCNEATKAGHGGETRTGHTLGRTGPTSFEFTYNTYSVPDQVEVFYEGRSLYSTNGYVGTRGDKTVTVAVPAGRADYVTVVVNGNTTESTDWDYTVHCPA
ncbi:hypothetical protein ABLE94_16820 [Gordonia sp. VNK1]|uniref:hypothetical protein n=1 Tax=Gordonia oleivorans TaxID=3156618 RepID=UPI0032B5900B